MACPSDVDDTEVQTGAKTLWACDVLRTRMAPMTSPRNVAAPVKMAMGIHMGEAMTRATIQMGDVMKAARDRRKMTGGRHRRRPTSMAGGM
jgi:hypothetical protein